MPNGQNKLSRFWLEFKRFKVIHVITVYVSTAFFLIKLVYNLTEPLKIRPKLTIIGI